MSRGRSFSSAPGLVRSDNPHLLSHFPVGHSPSGTVVQSDSDKALYQDVRSDMVTSDPLSGRTIEIFCPVVRSDTATLPPRVRSDRSCSFNAFCPVGHSGSESVFHVEPCLQRPLSMWKLTSTPPLSTWTRVAASRRSVRSQTNYHPLRHLDFPTRKVNPRRLSDSEIAHKSRFRLGN